MTQLVNTLVLVSLPVLIFVAVTNIYITLKSRPAGWRTSLPGFGGAGVISGYSVYWQFSEPLGMAIVLFGVACMCAPQVDAVLRDYATRLLDNETRGGAK